MPCTWTRSSCIASTTNRILRYDLTLPLLLTVRYEGQPLRIWTAGKAYRLCQIDAMHLDAFHQAEALCLDERSRLDPWRMTGQVLQSVDLLFPGRTVKIVPTEYAMCSQAWELEVEDDGRWFEVLAWGVFTDKIVRHLGGDPDCAHGCRRRLRSRAPGHAALRHRRHPQDRRRQRRVIETIRASVRMDSVLHCRRDAVSELSGGPRRVVLLDVRSAED